MEPKQALLVDNSTQTRDIITKILIDAGYSVKFALNGKEGLTKLYNKNNFFDLVITEVNLPGTGGLNLIRMTRNELRHKKIPIIAMADNFEKQRVEECVKAGATDLLLKPFEPADLKKVIRLCSPP
ncbi:MAG: response regulator [Deltaproteobacteria bacterium]|nr:response regulator [Deltaproteobacteria bacterium]